MDLQANAVSELLVLQRNRSGDAGSHQRGGGHAGSRGSRTRSRSRRRLGNAAGVGDVDAGAVLSCAAGVWCVDRGAVLSDATNVGGVDAGAVLSCAAGVRRVDRGAVLSCATNVGGWIKQNSRPGVLTMLWLKT